LANGALGGKLLGAGGGGFMLLFVPPAKQERVRAALNKLINVPFHFEFSGSQIIFFEPERDYSAEEKLRAVREFNFLGEAKNPSAVLVSELRPGDLTER
jgi:D-glycero-alpha-D-manno-heptose-7-phosphate kinase